MNLSPDLDFDGVTYEPEHDKARLTSLYVRVFEVMSAGRWMTLGEINHAAGASSEASISARLRDMRKERFGGHTVNRRRRGAAAKGIFEYRLERKPDFELTS